MLSLVFSRSVDVFAAGVCPITVSMVVNVLNPGAPLTVTALVQDTPEQPATTVSQSNIRFPNSR